MRSGMVWEETPARPTFCGTDAAKRLSRGGGE